MKSPFKFRIPWLTIVFIVMALIVIHYYRNLAADRFVSRTQFVVASGSETKASGTFLDSIVGGGSASRDAYIIINYIKSLDMLNYLIEQGFDIRGHYSEEQDDYFFRMDPDGSKNDLHKYFTERIDAFYDDVEGIVKMEVQAFTAEFAQKITEAMILKATAYVNENNRVIANKQMAVIIEELKTAEEGLASARLNLHTFQIENAVIDPIQEAGSRLELIQTLNKEKISLRAEIKGLKDYNPNIAGTPRVKEMEARMAALEIEINSVKGTLIGENDGKMSKMISDYGNLQVDSELAMNKYQQTLSAFETTRVEAGSASRYLTVIEQPFVPDEALYPRRVFMSISVLIVGFLILQLVNLLVRTVMEH